MKAAAARMPLPTSRVAAGMGCENDRIIPDPFDPRLISAVAPAVAKAAAESGVARWPIEDLAEYAEKLEDAAAGLILGAAVALAIAGVAVRERKGGSQDWRRMVHSS